MLPPAPGLLSTTTCWPQISDSRAPTMRAMPSMPPPGVNGTTSLTTRVGQACDDVACANARPAIGICATVDAADSATRWRRVIIVSSFVVALPPRLVGVSSVDPDPGVLDHWTPFVDIGLEMGGELIGGRADHGIAEQLQPRLDRGSGEARDGVGVDLPDDVGRGLRGQKEGVPGRYLEARHSGFGDGRQLGRRGIALGAGDCEPAQLTRLDQLERDAAGELQVDAPGDEIAIGGAGAAIGHMRHLDAGHPLEQLAGHVWRRA